MSGSEPGAEDLLARAARAGVHTIALPTPFLVGPVNCYVVEDEPLTLIDTGPNSGRSLDELEQALARLGRSIEDLERIVVTHQHMDHVGLLEILARRSGAEVAALHLLGPYLERFPRSAEADDAFAETIMRRHGVPEDMITVLSSVGAAFRGFGSSARVTRELRDGDELRFAHRTLHVLHRPGHSPSDTVFWDEQRELLIGGDHLLAGVSSNPLVSRPLDAAAPPPDGRTHALIQYMESLRATRELPARLVLGGHGEPIADHAALIDERLRMHARRARKILRMLDRGPRTAYELAYEMWGNVAVTQAFLTLSEVLGHLDVLVAAGEVQEEPETAEPVRFRALRPS